MLNPHSHGTSFPGRRSKGWMRSRANADVGMRAVIPPVVADRTFSQAIPGLTDARQWTRACGSSRSSPAPSHAHGVRYDDNEIAHFADCGVCRALGESPCHVQRRIAPQRTASLDVGR